MYVVFFAISSTSEDTEEIALWVGGVSKFQGFFYFSVSTYMASTRLNRIENEILRRTFDAILMNSLDDSKEYHKIF